MPRKAKNPVLAQNRAQTRDHQDVDSHEDSTLDYDRDDLAALTASQGRSPVSLSSDDMAFQ